jgi:hypothetical protein
MAHYVIRFQRPARQVGTLGEAYDAASLDAALVNLRHARQKAVRNCRYWVEKGEK